MKFTDLKPVSIYVIFHLNNNISNEAVSNEAMDKKRIYISEYMSIR